MLEVIGNIVGAISGFLYQPYIVPLFLVAAGLFFTIRSGFIQVRLFPEMFKVVSEKPNTAGGISSFGALMVSTASRVGTGNIVGVSAALCCGGPGALFWMWITAILGGASAFVESTLAQIYKKKNPDGSSFGGPSYYMQDALKQRWLGIVFAVIIILTYAVGYNMLAAYNLQSAFSAFSFYSAPDVANGASAFGGTPLIIGIILAVLFAVCIMGGAKRLTNVTGVLVPVMGIIYVLVSLLVIIMNIGNLGSMFAAIFRSAFDFQAIFGGFFGSCIMYGIKRGLYSNEAGMGSAPNAAASADVSHPAKQGLVQMLSVFIDTLLICTATALMCLSTGIAPVEELQGAPWVQTCMRDALGNFGPVFMATSLALFAFTTLIGNYYYCEGCLKFIMKKEPSKSFITVFRIVAAVLVLVGACASAGLVWDTADMLQGMMVVINIPVIIILTKPAMACLQDYIEQRKVGKNPEYNAKANGIKEDVDFWK